MTTAKQPATGPLTPPGQFLVTNCQVYNPCFSIKKIPKFDGVSKQRTSDTQTRNKRCPGGGECARLRENVPYVKVHRYNPKHLYQKLNGYGDNGERKLCSSCGSMYCTSFAYCYSYTVHVRPSVSQPSQAHSAFIINRCHSYSEL